MHLQLGRSYPEDLEENKSGAFSAGWFSDSNMPYIPKKKGLFSLMAHKYVHIMINWPNPFRATVVSPAGSIDHFSKSSIISKF